MVFPGFSQNPCRFHHGQHPVLIGQTTLKVHVIRFAHGTVAAQFNRSALNEGPRRHNNRIGIPGKFAWYGNNVGIDRRIGLYGLAELFQLFRRAKGDALDNIMAQDVRRRLYIVPQPFKIAAAKIAVLTACITT